jgi:hypothetical protein
MNVAAPLHPLHDAAYTRRCAGAGLLCFGLSSAVGTWHGASAAKSTTRWWLLLCWAAAALFATAGHLGFALGLRAAGFDSRSNFLQGESKQQQQLLCLHRASPCASASFM